MQKTTRWTAMSTLKFLQDFTGCHQMETFSALLALWSGNSPVTGEFPAQRPVTRIFYVFFDLRLNKRLGKQSWGWWFETPWRSLWRHCNVHQFKWHNSVHKCDTRALIGTKYWNYGCLNFRAAVWLLTRINYKYGTGTWRVNLRIYQHNGDIKQITFYCVRDLSFH